MELSFTTIKSRFLEVWRHAGFQKYFRNTGWMFFGQMFSLFISFIVGAWLARYLGPKNYGIINYAISFVGLFYFVSHLGIYGILIRDLVDKPEKKDKLLGTSFWLIFVGSLVSFCLILIFSFLFEPSSFVRKLIILYASSFFVQAFMVINIFFQATVQAKKNVYAGVFAGVISSLLKIFLIITGQGIILLMLVFVLEAILNMTLLVLIYKSSGYKFSNWKFDKKIAKQILSGSWMLMFAAASSYIFIRVDQVMIRNFLDETSLGFYAAALKLVEVWYFIPSILCTSLLPAIINAKKIDGKKYLNRLKKLYLLLVSLAIFIAVPITVLAPWIINFLFGNEYLESIGVLRIYIWSGVGFFLNVGFYQYFLAENRLKEIFYFYIFLMILNIILNIILISIFGLTGAAWSTLISYFIGLLIFFILNNSFFNKKKYLNSV